MGGFGGRVAATGGGVSKAMGNTRASGDFGTTFKNGLGDVGKEIGKGLGGGINRSGLDGPLGNVAGGAENFGSDIGQKAGFGDRKQQDLAKQGEEEAGKQFDETGGVYDTMNADDTQYLQDISGQHAQYEGARDTAIGKADRDLERLGNEASSQATDARKVYAGTVAPALKDAMGASTKEAKSAMTLKQAADPNNNVQKDYRNLYNNEASTARTAADTEAARARGEFDTEGQGAQNAYNTEAANARGEYNSEGQAQQDDYNATGTRMRGEYDQMGKGFRTQGLQDAGVLSALGAQATAGQFAGMPIGGAQLQAAQGRNQAAAGEAYAKGAQRMQALKEQGLGYQADMAGQGTAAKTRTRGEGLATATQTRRAGVDTNTAMRHEGRQRETDARLGAREKEAGMRERGIDTGRNESNAQYERGVGAREKARQSTMDVANAQDQANASSRQFRDEESGISSDRMGLATGKARDTLNLGTDRANIGQGNRQNKSGRQLAAINQKYGYSQGRISDQIARENAIQAGKVNAIGSGVQLGTTVAGGVLGGPGGAALGNQGGGVARSQMNDNAGNNSTYSGPAPGAGAAGGYRSSRNPYMEQQGQYYA